EGTPILRDVSFEVPAGSTLAIVGSTGSGKSTIINLLTRFYDYSHGSVRLDGVELNQIQKINLRSHISLVLQDVFLFSGTVRDEIRLINPEITEEKILQASRSVGAHRFRMALRGG